MRISAARATDCNGNGIPDNCDISCGAPGGPCDVPFCGTKPDCNGNGVPDGCEINSLFIADSVADFSEIQGYRGWRYGYLVSPYTTSTFTELTQFGFDSDFGIKAWHLQLGAGGFWTAIGELLIHPNGPTTGGGRQNVGHRPCRRWVSDRAGPVHLTGRLAKIDANDCGGCDGVRGHIYVDGAEIWNQFVAQTDSIGVPFNLTANLNYGSTVDFVLDPIGFDGKDASTFTATISGGDCNANGVLDVCDIASGTSQDCNSDGVPDECQPQDDCNDNGIPDICEAVSRADCDSDGITDLCEISGGAPDCNSNGVPDGCEINSLVITDSAADFSEFQGYRGWRYGYLVSPYATSTFADLTQFGFDSDFGIKAWHLQLGAGGFWTAIGESFTHPNGPTTSGGRQNVGHWTCRRWISDRAGPVHLTGRLAKYDANDCGGCDGVRGHIFVDGVEIWNQLVAQTDSTGVPFNLTAVVNYHSTVDFVLDPIGYDGKDASTFTATISGGDCNANGVLDSCDITGGTSRDCNHNGIPDECEGNGPFPCWDTIPGPHERR